MFGEPNEYFVQHVPDPKTGKMKEMYRSICNLLYEMEDDMSHEFGRAGNDDNLD